jgi:hypothetical protein
MAEYTERSSDNAKVPRQPNCLRCAYFRVTWDPAFPRACDMFGFKGMGLPSGEVFRATGQSCPAFRLKDGLAS